jgi:hypothetical protein
MNFVKFSGRRRISRHCAMAMQKKEKILGRTTGATEGGALGPGAVPVTLGLFLLPGGRPGRRFTGAADASTRATPTSRRHRRTKVQTRTICVHHVDKGKG